MELLKNTRVAGGLGALICGAVALGVYQPDAAGSAAITGLVAVCGGGALAAGLAWVAAKRAKGVKP